MHSREKEEESVCVQGLIFGLYLLGEDRSHLGNTEHKMGIQDLKIPPRQCQGFLSSFQEVHQVKYPL